MAFGSVTCRISGCERFAVMETNRVCFEKGVSFVVCQDLIDKISLYRITLVDFQLDAQNSYLFTYNIFIKILYMFRALLCSSSGGLRRNCVYAASGIVTLCR